MENIKIYWDNFLSTSENNLKYKNRTYDWFSFGVNSDKLAKWVIDGKKTATSSLYENYLNDKEEIPKKGNCSIILNSSNKPVCIIEINKVEVLKFMSVTESMARMEIKEQNALELWRKSHFNFFSTEAQEIGEIFSKESLIVFESFSVIYK